MSRRSLCSLAALCIWIAASSLARGDELPVVGSVEAQPLKAQAKRIAEALDFVGQPLTKEQAAALAKAAADTDDAAAVEAIQKVFDPLCLAGVNLNPESRVKVARGAAEAELVQQGWRVFLVKVHNEAGVTGQLQASSPNAQPVYTKSSNSPAPKPT
jgi:hypothetical protein